MIKNMSLKNKILLSLSVLTLSGFGIVTGVFVNNMKDNAYKHSLNVAENSTTEYSAKVKNIIEPNFEKVNTLI